MLRPQKLLLLFGLCALCCNSAHAKPSKETKELDNKPASAADKSKSSEFPEEASDMLMEPNTFTPIAVLRPQEQQFRAVVPTNQFRSNVNSQIAPRADISSATDLHTQAAQNFYPPFFREAPPLGHSRPYFPSPESQPISKYAAQRIETIGGPAQRGFDATILGSGDFGVLRGGTFYPEEEMPYHHVDENSDLNQFGFGDANNGHGRPSTEGFIQKYTYPEEQFADFRDFADINTPADSAFSQFVVVYAAKNSTKAQTAAEQLRPKNIFEQLELFDREKALDKDMKQSTTKSKSKLSKTKLQKKYKKKPSPKDFDYEPLLALS